MKIMKIILNKEDILTYGKEKTEYYINLHEKISKIIIVV